MEVIKAVETMSATDSSLSVRAFSTATLAFHKLKASRDMATMQAMVKDGRQGPSQGSVHVQ